jgi:NAD(P)-dependent dehydrogenase (short-subunit alcohol dehydrogenase family)
MSPDPASDPFRLDGRVALVTGAGGGIGSATCVALARAGAVVAALETDAATMAATVAAVEAEGGRAVPLAGDVRREDDVGRLFDDAEAQLGPIDLLVNTAFAARHHRPDEMPLDDWEFNLEINLTGYFLCAREAARRMIERGSGGDDALMDRIRAGIPLDRLGNLEEIARPVVFLASPAASLITGVILPADGGNLAMNAGGSHTY